MPKTIYLNKNQVETLTLCILEDIKSEEYSMPDFSDSKQTGYFFIRSLILRKLKRGASILNDDETDVSKAIVEYSIDATRFDMQHSLPDFTDSELTEFWHNRATLLEKL